MLDVTYIKEGKENMGKKIDTLIVGATYFGLGYASVHPESVVIESSQILGGDFHHCARFADLSVLTEKEASTEIAESMKKEHVFEDGKFDVLKASPVIHQFVSERLGKNMQVLLDAKLLEVNKLDSGFELKYIDNEGLHQISCDKILDTTMERETYPAGAICTKKSLNLFTVSVENEFEEKLNAIYPNIEIKACKNEDEKLVCIPFTPEKKMLEAYEEMTEIWKKAFPKGKERILFVADKFEYTCEAANEAEAPCAWNGGRFANPLTAFLQGMEYQL